MTNDAPDGPTNSQAIAPRVVSDVADRMLYALDVRRSLGEWLVKQGKRDDVAREWPIQHPPAGWEPNQIPEPPAVIEEVA